MEMYMKKFNEINNHISQLYAKDDRLSKHTKCSAEVFFSYWLHSQRISNNYKHSIISAILENDLHEPYYSLFYNFFEMSLPIIEWVELSTGPCGSQLNKRIVKLSKQNDLSNTNIILKTLSRFESCNFYKFTESSGGTEHQDKCLKNYLSNHNYRLPENYNEKDLYVIEVERKLKPGNGTFCDTYEVKALIV